MQTISKDTLIRIRDQLGAHAWSDAELQELVAPSMGIISGLPGLLRELDELRAVDLGSIPPAGSVPRISEE